MVTSPPSPLDDIARCLRELDRLLGSRSTARITIEREGVGPAVASISQAAGYLVQWASGRVEALEPPPRG